MNVVAHNLLSMNTSRQLGIVTKNNSKSTERLSSGYRINRAADDAAGLTISEKMRAQIRGLNKAESNIQDGVSVCQIADGALNEVSDMLHRITELTIQAANDTNTEQDRNAIQDEINELVKEIDKIGNTTEFNTQPLFKGTDELLTNADGSPLIWGDIPVSDFSLTNVDLGLTPFAQSTNANRLCLQAIVNNPDSAAYGQAFNLIYGNGSTSHSSFRVEYANTASGALTQQTVSFDNLRSSNLVADTSNPDAPSWSRDFTFTNSAEGIDIKITQKIQAVTVSDSEKTYKISYDVVNNSTKDVNFDFMFHADTAYNNNDICEGYYTNGTRIDKYTVYTNPDSPFTQGATNANVINNIPSDFSIVDTQNSLSFSEKISFTSGTPDSLSIGHYSSVDDWSYYNAPIGSSQLGTNSHNKDLGFSAMWNDQLAANGSTVTYAFDYGIISTGADANVAGVPITPNTTTVTNHDAVKKMWIQSGSLEESGMYLTIEEMNSTVLGINRLNVTSHEDATRAIGQVSNALLKVNSNRSSIGAQQNRLEASQRNVANIGENTQAAESRLRDTDMANEMVEFSKNNILIQAGQAMLTQANQSSQGVLSLLQ